MKSSHAKALAATYLADLLRSTFEDAPTLAGELPMQVEVPHELWEQALVGPLADFLERPGKEFRARLMETAHRLAGARRVRARLRDGGHATRGHGHGGGL